MIAGYRSPTPDPSSETQGQIVGTRESLNGRKNVARRKVKNGEKSLWGQCLTRPVPNGRRCSGFWLVPENLCFSGTNQKPERRTGLVRHCPQGLFSPFFTFLPSSETQGQSVGPGEKARRKFSNTGGRAPGYRLSPDHFQTVK